MTVIFRGKPACPCLATWLPVYEDELLRRGVIRHNIDIYQLIGGAKASGGTHATGGAFDIAQTSVEAIAVARSMGADATWHRPLNWDGRGGMEHTHGVLRGCPHNGPARYQIAAVDAGYNGLGHLGHGARDNGPRPLSHRTWEQGIAWAKDQGKLPPRPAPLLDPVAGPRVVDVVIATNNVMSLPKNPDVMATLKAATAGPTVVGLQELDPPSFKAAAEAIGGWDLTDIPASVEYAEAIMFDEDVWDLVHRRFVKQYDGAKRISYTRHFCVTRLRHKAHGFEAVFVSFHAVTQGEDTKRVAMRRSGLRLLRTVITQYRKAGVPIFVMGDYNSRLPQHPTATLKLRHGIDHIYFWNGRRVTGSKNKVRTVATSSDHDVFIARITLKVKETS